MTTLEIISLITEDGWYPIRTGGGGHRQYFHPTKSGKVTIPFHGKGKDIDRWLVKKIKKQAGLK
ncbi:MAG: type II toxin-antitoxin system HicA family toxin [Opitutaceae bacterium]|jgi:predicted RNA binding protein YcfA (HicA-like mRNA interferase family)|nr:type II toxin-antitoxin system HicA family toxin [Opitutaceae bacterium]